MGQSWLDDVRRAVDRDDEKEPDEGRKRRADGAASREYIESRKHVLQVIEPVLREAAEELNSLGRHATVSLGSADMFSGDPFACELTMSNDTHQWLLVFSVVKGQPGIHVGASDFPRDTLTRDEVRATVSSWVVGVIGNEIPAVRT